MCLFLSGQYLDPLRIDGGVKILDNLNKQKMIVFKNSCGKTKLSMLVYCFGRFSRCMGLVLCCASVSIEQRLSAHVYTFPEGLRFSG